VQLTLPAGRHQQQRWPRASVVRLPIALLSIRWGMTRRVSLLPRCSTASWSNTPLLRSCHPPPLRLRHLVPLRSRHLVRQWQWNLDCYSTRRVSQLLDGPSPPDECTRQQVSSPTCFHKEYSGSATTRINAHPNDRSKPRTRFPVIQALQFPGSATTSRIQRRRRIRLAPRILYILPSQDVPDHATTTRLFKDTRWLTFGRRALRCYTRPLRVRLSPLFLRPAVGWWAPRHHNHGARLRGRC
jgi:hypothetical protein